MLNKKKAFTLIELLVVISIIAVLMSIMMPALSRAREQAKMTVCSSNQHQIVVGLQTYQSDYGKLPPSIQGTISGAGQVSWTMPLRLNYGVPGGNTSFTGMNGASVGVQLSPYLPVAEVWGCPVSKTFQGKYQDEYRQGLPIDVQDSNYPRNWGYLNSSYWLVWNYLGWEQYGFVGAGQYSKNKVLIGDMTLWNNGVWLNQQWGSSHRLPNASIKGDDAGGYWWKQMDTEHKKPKVTLNAGYVDGHVAKYNLDDAFEFKVSSTNTYFYLPPLN